MGKKHTEVASTPSGQTPTLNRLGSTGEKSQKTLHGFFTKTPGTTLPATALPTRLSPRKKNGSLQSKMLASPSSSQLTPAPSSDAIEPAEDIDEVSRSPPPAGLLSPSSSANSRKQTKRAVEEVTAYGTPSRKAKKKVIKYAESDSEGTDDDAFLKKTPTKSKKRPAKRRKVSESGDEDVYEEEDKDSVEFEDEMDDFIAPDDSDEEVKPTNKRKRPSLPASRKPSQTRPVEPLPDYELDLPEKSTATQWQYDPDNLLPLQDRSANIQSKKPGTKTLTKKEKARSDPEKRHAWLEVEMDMDRNPVGHPDYDPRTLYIPPSAWREFSPFEKQYWEIKQKYWDTIVFFKKGKFYELYEKDATIGHQLFDLKLTDRVNMRMVGVPEMSLEMWANQFVAKGFKIARVDQKETALGKEMREKDDNSAKKKDIIHRELACVLTAGTLVDGTMLTDDMSTYCVAIKESEIDDLPALGISFVDTATGQFFVTQFVDDVDMTKFETFVAQTRPQEILLEKGGVSVRTLRILKNNTGPTTIWNYMKPGKEFWEGHITAKEIEASDYFPGEWPSVLQESKEKDLLMSSLGALIQYLRTLQIERDLVSLGNFTWYDPIRKATSLVLDGQTLINLEVFANSYDGGDEGTLFQLLNRCITPFGKRLFKQWVCHPLMDTTKINARLDAVDSLNADTKVRDRFTSQMTKMPDLERLISRIHAGSCRAQDFLRVLEGFEQIDHTMALLKENSGYGALNPDSVIGQLILACPELRSRLEYWMTAFDRTKAKENGILVPERGIEGDFDHSQDTIEAIHADLEELLNKSRKELGSSAICYRDIGKEIFQLEIPKKAWSKIPKSWDQLSATQQVKRYYFPELKKLVRKLQEAQETHSQIVKEVAGRFYARFDENYEIWLAATKIIGQLDCLISLAKASSSLGTPSCRPTFVDDERSVLDLQELRHPCLLANVDDFIPNDVVLGGDNATMTLLTGANAAGKSTVLRMTCVAVIMAQVGCYLPCTSARLTPVDRIMSRLGAQDHIFAGQSTFMVELSETKKILAEASPRSLVILDELGRGTSSSDGVAVAEAVLWHLASHVRCLGFFATHYHSLAHEFEAHQEVEAKRMGILVDDEERRVTFLYKLEPGVSEGSFGMHCAAMCGISKTVVENAEIAAKERGMEVDRKADAGNKWSDIPLGVLSDLAWMLREGTEEEDVSIDEAGIDALARCIEAL